MQKIIPFLMFTKGGAQEALKYYTSIFEDSKTVSIERYGKGESEPEGNVAKAVFTLNGQTFMCIDSSAAPHQFTFTPAISLYVTCKTEAEIEVLFEKLSAGGAVLMELAAYPFSPKFAWVQDKFGVSWQLSLAADKK
jgi:predicted 3-demethylubiquinone-9 3-methyltransferase (glyoxalase superfamily)